MSSNREIKGRIKQSNISQFINISQDFYDRPRNAARSYATWLKHDSLAGCCHYIETFCGLSWATAISLNTKLSSNDNTQLANHTYGELRNNEQRFVVCHKLRPSYRPRNRDISRTTVTIFNKSESHIHKLRCYEMEASVAVTSYICLIELRIN